MINEKLQELYEKKWDTLLSNASGTNAAYPLLIKVDTAYQDANIKVMIVGQETDGWIGLLEENKENMAAVQDAYYKYLYENKKKNRRPFWNRKNFRYYKEELTKIFSPNNKIAFIWNNISKIGNKGSGKPTEKIKILENKCFNVFEEELKILEPDIIIFTTGNRRIPIEHDAIETVGEKHVAEIKFKNYPNILAVRTYHPNAKIKGGKKQFKKEIVELINRWREISDPLFNKKFFNIYI